MIVDVRIPAALAVLVLAGPAMPAGPPISSPPLAVLLERLDRVAGLYHSGALDFTCIETVISPSSSRRTQRTGRRIHSLEKLPVFMVRLRVCTKIGWSTMIVTGRVGLGADLPPCGCSTGSCLQNTTHKCEVLLSCSSPRVNCTVGTACPWA